MQFGWQTKNYAFSEKMRTNSVWITKHGDSFNENNSIAPKIMHAKNRTCNFTIHDKSGSYIMFLIRDHFYFPSCLFVINLIQKFTGGECISNKYTDEWRCNLLCWKSWTSCQHVKLKNNKYILCLKWLKKPWKYANFIFYGF